MATLWVTADCLIMVEKCPKGYRSNIGWLLWKRSGSKMADWCWPKKSLLGFCQPFLGGWKETKWTT